MATAPEVKPNGSLPPGRKFRTKHYLLTPTGKIRLDDVEDVKNRGQVQAEGRRAARLAGIPDSAKLRMIQIDEEVHDVDSA